MKIKQIRAYIRNLALTRPYTIASRTISDVENVFLEVELENGMIGTGAANPAPEVVGEGPEQTLANAHSSFFEELAGSDIRYFKQWIGTCQHQFPNLPGTQALLDIALHDAFCQWLDIPVAAFYGQYWKELPTSVTIGIMTAQDTIQTAEEYKKMGFRVLKVKLGLDLEEDLERLRKLREVFGTYFTVRVDANQGYSLPELQRFLKAVQSLDIELVEQPLPVGHESDLLVLSADERRLLAADESLKDASYALKWAQTPRPFGIYNIKLMKCGGITGGLDIARIAQAAGIDLFWGCNDESIVSISAALHTAFASPNTRYLDLDGSLDLAEDVVSGGFQINDGLLSLAPGSGLGLKRI